MHKYYIILIIISCSKSLNFILYLGNIDIFYIKLIVHVRLKTFFFTTSKTIDHKKKQQSQNRKLTPIQLIHKSI